MNVEFARQKCEVKEVTEVNDDVERDYSQCDIIEAKRRDPCKSWKVPEEDIQALP